MPGTMLEPHGNGLSAIMTESRVGGCAAAPCDLSFDSDHARPRNYLAEGGPISARQGMGSMTEAAGLKDLSLCATRKVETS